jgi:hypothetical protein
VKLSDFKIFALIGVLLVAAVAYFGDWKKHLRPYSGPPEPTFRIVPAGTPGAKTWIEQQEANGIRYRRW